MSQEYYNNTEEDFFMYNVVWSDLDNIVKGIYPVQCCSMSIKTTGFFLVKCCLEHLGQHWLRYLIVQCCCKRIKTTLKRIFYCVMLPGSSRTTLHRVFIVQCCPKSIKTILNRNFYRAILSGVSWTTLHKIFSYAILSQEY